jgi:DNA-binding transcriptional MerR regulator
MNPQFHFTVTDLARFLGKSPVTLRGWERDKLLTIPRDAGGDRKLTCDEVIDVAHRAYKLNRIRAWRLDLVITAMTLLKLIERENKR